jgi:hypothetical protein
MGDWLRHIALTAKARSGFGPQLVFWFLIAAVALALALGFLCAAVYVWLASRTDTMTACLIMGGGFALIALIAAFAGWIARLRNIERARRELAARSQTARFDPRYLTVGIEIGRALGWRRVVALAAVGLLAAGLGKEWFASGKSKPEGSDGD